MVSAARQPSRVSSSTVRILSSHEYMYYLPIVQVFVRTPSTTVKFLKVPHNQLKYPRMS
jgi:hypothetical protein